MKINESYALAMPCSPVNGPVSEKVLFTYAASFLKLRVTGQRGAITIVARPKLITELNC